MLIKNCSRFSLFSAPSGDNPFTAMGLLLFGVIVLALQDTLIKYIAPETSFWQMQTIRSFGNLGLVI